MKALPNSKILAAGIALFVFALVGGVFLFLNQNKTAADFLSRVPSHLKAEGSHSMAVSYMHDIGSEIKGNILSATLQGLQRTRLLAKSPELVEAFEKNDVATLKNLANRDFLQALELDIIAFFNKEGAIVAMNTVDKDGRPIAQERIDRVMNASFEGREIISGCLLNKNKKTLVEFQTGCDFTPALFDSSGLSVAFSIPAVKFSSNERVGLVSTRLNFKRILDAAEGKNLRFKDGEIFLVSDSGKYFSEEINSGKQKPPIPESAIMDLIKPLSLNPSLEQDIFLHQGGYYINIFSLGIRETMDKGNLYVLVRAPKAWVESESRKMQGLIAFTGVAGLLIVLLAAFLVSLNAARARAVQLAHKMTENLHAEMDERKRLEARMVQSEKLVAVGQLAGGVAHEINNPLGVILGFAQNIAHKITPNDPLELPIKSIEREAVRCKNLVQELMTFARVTRMENEPVCLKEIIDSTLLLVTAQANVKNVVLSKEIESVPKIPANRTQIQQIVVNLCNNAIDAMPEGGNLIVRLSEQKMDGKAGVEIQVQDTGRGIPEEIRRDIFNPFFTTKEVGKGTGLGLSLVYEIVVKHNGQITFDSVAGHGTTFKVFLPAAA